MCPPNNAARNDFKQIPETLDELFRSYLEVIQEKLTELVGRTATRAIFRSAWNKSIQSHPTLARCDLGESGVTLVCDDEGVSQNDILIGYLAYIGELMHLLIDLTGDVLANRITPLVEQFDAEAREMIQSEEETS